MRLAHRIGMRVSVCAVFLSRVVIFLSQQGYLSTLPVTLLL